MDTGMLAPSLPPPLPMGKQCAPDDHATCGCSGGICECDLYPDYSPQHLAPSSPSRRSNAPRYEDERTVVPPLRRLQFFNSNFKSHTSMPPSPARHSSKHSRALKERRTGPSLRVLCYCRCPVVENL